MELSEVIQFARKGTGNTHDIAMVKLLDWLAECRTPPEHLWDSYRHGLTARSPAWLLSR